MFSCLRNVIGVSVKPVNHVAAVRSQFGGQLSIPTTQMDNQPPLDASTLEDLSGRNRADILLYSFSRLRKRHERQSS